MIKIHKIFDIIRMANSEPREIIKNGILPENALLFISGQPKARKSFLVFNIVLAIATGKSFACFNIPKPRKVLLLSAEGGDNPNSKRLNRMYETLADTDEMKELVNENLSVSFISKLTINNPEHYARLKEVIQTEKPDVVILDPLVRFHDLDENSANQMDQVFSNIRELIDRYNLSVILIHHHGKNDSNGLRGSSAMAGEYDSSIMISALKDNNHNLKFDLRHNESPNDTPIHFNTDTFWFESKGTATEDKFLDLIKEKPLEKSKWVQLGISLNMIKKATAYKRIDEWVEKGIVSLGLDKTYAMS